MRSINGIILRDARFTLQTDHKNLTYINFEGTAKVRRWKLLIQEYDFSIEFIKGEDNVIADAFSRLCLDGASTPETPTPSSAAGGGASTAPTSVLPEEEIAQRAETLAEQLTCIYMELERPECQLMMLDEETICPLIDGDLPFPQWIRDELQSVHNSLVGHAQWGEAHNFEAN